MGLPQDRDAKIFWRSALQRHDDAETLLAAGRNTGAVYLAGYSVECALKALLIESTPRNDRTTMVASFRGSKAHDFEWLREQYRKVKGPPIPADVHEQFVLVSTWSTDFRYRPGIIKPDDAEDFLKAAKAIVAWADGRI
ncbi:MAG: HEPN domain-containing protein [Pirellulales bacterium]